ncbi:4-hydroxy-3-methylbut-2-enyl diphosphate reductase [Klebsiella pneumoniae]|uniref:4-hydroxy-3-methylbut-2-enyl diphosphate reductase n=1 Tax=Klebsiella pneumoniae TaxID=573 RepID=A0A377WGF5_KLEPN|nr:4-hydroxy-3-methylbut-2-enyl diphosphate reductase [Klebsiella pneumoniae]
MQILLANPRGFCAGVDRAISIVENALTLYGAPIYVRHEVVHNRYVVDSLRKRGAIFIEQISEVPDGAILIFSAHGVSQAVRNEAKSRDLTVFDATCPLVTKVHMEVAPRQPPRRRVDSDWPCRPSGSRRHHGTVQQPARGDVPGRVAGRRAEAGSEK